MYPQTTLSSRMLPPGVAQSEFSFSRLSEMSAVGGASEASRLPSYFPTAVTSLQGQNRFYDSDAVGDYGCVASSGSRDTVSTAGRPSVQLTIGPRSQLVRGLALGFSGAPTEPSAYPRDIRREAVDRLYQFLRTESQLQQNGRHQHQHQHCSYSTVTTGVNSEPLHHPPSSSSSMLVTPPCGHLGYRKRLRVKKGYSYFVCRYCGLKWRFPTQRRQEELLLQSQLVCS